MSDSMFSAAFDVSIKISESYRPQKGSSSRKHEEPDRREREFVQMFWKKLFTREGELKDHERWKSR